jgi:serine/threonine-protein kinase
MQGGFVPKIGIRKGDIVAGKYRVDWVLGTGSTGVVLAAYHLKLHERVAIKLLLPEAMSNPEAVKRFEREARAAVKIKSEHVARIIDVQALTRVRPTSSWSTCRARISPHVWRERAPCPSRKPSIS